MHHLRYDYFGVVVNADEACVANDDWYNRNRTQPGRDQPWYNVLVNGGANTYVAEENLEIARDGIQIEHPMLYQMFASYHDGRYFKTSLN